MKVAVGSKTIPIAVAEYVRGNDWKRLIDSIDISVLQKTVDKVATAVTGSNLGLTKNEEDRTDRFVVQYANARDTVENPRANPIAVPCRIPVQKILESTSQLLAKTMPEKRYLGNTFTMIQVRMP